ncbi:MAG: hypothetical protein M3Z96_11460 [Pseudomonadota bacterium]|nr:hypothetical protein [Pseudomonadota bacterium]
MNALAREFAQSRAAISKHVRVLRALSCGPRDFAGCLRDIAAAGVWGGEK